MGSEDEVMRSILTPVEYTGTESTPVRGATNSSATSPRIGRSDSPVLEKHTGRALESMATGMSAFTKCMETMMSSASKISRKRKSLSDTDSDEGHQEPVLISYPNHDLKDNAKDIIDWKARSLRPFRGEQKEYWKKQPRVARPIMSDLRNSHLTESPLNPKLIEKLHDRGTELSLKMFHSGNINVEQRRGKVKLDEKSSAAAFQLDYKEPQTVWETVDCVQRYTITLRSVRPDDYTGDLLLRVLHEYRYFAGVSRTDGYQKALITKFVEKVFVENSNRGRSRTPPLDYSEVSRKAKITLHEAGHLEGNLVGVDPYTGARSRTISNDGKRSDWGSGPRQLPSTGNDRKRDQNQGYRSYGGRNTGAGNRGSQPNGGQDQKVLQEKINICCRHWNNKSGCNVPSCNFDHKCNIAVGPRSVCWSKQHNAVNHK